MPDSAPGSAASNGDDVEQLATADVEPSHGVLQDERPDVVRGGMLEERSLRNVLLIEEEGTRFGP